MRIPPPRYDHWGVAVPVIFVVILGFLLGMGFFCVLAFLHFGQEAIFLVEGGPFSPRTGFLVLAVSVAGYTGLWIVIHLREASRRGRRKAVRRPIVTALILLLPFLVSLHAAYVFQRMPTAKEYLKSVEAEVRDGEFEYFCQAVRLGVPGVDELSVKLREEEDADLALYGAAGAYHCGDRSEKTRGILRDRIEGFRAAAGVDRVEVSKLWWATMLIKEPAPAAMWYRHQLGESIGRKASPFWVWWNKVEPSFRASGDR